MKRLICLCLFVLLILAGCTYQETPQPEPETFLDRYNRNPELYNDVFRKLHEKYIQQIRWEHGETHNVESTR